jgi:hypothetical protein
MNRTDAPRLHFEPKLSFARIAASGRDGLETIVPANEQEGANAPKAELGRPRQRG